MVTGLYKGYIYFNKKIVSCAYFDINKNVDLFFIVKNYYLLIDILSTMIFF